MRDCIIISIVLAIGASARADVDIKLSGWVSSDIRYRVFGIEPRDPPVPSQWQLLRQGWSRNENRVRGALSIGIGRKIKGVADAELMMFGFSDLRDLDSSTLRDRVDPYYLEMHAAYIDVNNLIKGLDLRIGRQVVPWGAADKFNPVSNLNTLDLSDPLQFGRALANNMVRVDYNPIGDLALTLVVVPVFRPAQLPRTAPIAVLDPLRPAPVSDEEVRGALDLERSIYILDPRFRLSVDTVVLQPEVSLRNTQVALRLAHKLFGQDIALSYYHGLFGIPVPALSLITGSLTDAVARTGLVYPRVDIVGAEMAGSIEKLGGLGYWLEAAVNIPEGVSLALYEEVSTPGVRKALEYKDGIRFSHPLGTPVSRPLVVERTPFVKATIGIDYTIAGRIYLNLQYVHGFIDEFGAGRAARPRREARDVSERPRVESRIGDYLVGGIDVKLLSDRLLLRLFGVIKLPSVDLATRLWDEYAPTGVLFPQVIWTVWDATELMVGGFIMLGDRSTKFGDPAAGGTELFAKAKVSF